VFPGAIRLTILVPGSASEGAFAIYEDIVQPGVGPPRHIHHSQDEVFFVLDGSFDIEIDGQLSHATAGDVAYVPRGAVHAFKNVGSEPERLRYTFTPAGDTEEMFRAFFDAAQKGELGPKQMTEIAARFDQEFVGPTLKRQEVAMTEVKKARAVGINHVALEVGDIDEALEFYGKFLDFTLRGKHDTAAFIDLGDQFIALSKVDAQQRDHERHFGLVVDDKDAVRSVLDEMSVEIVSERFMDFYDPWGNRIEIVGYDGIQFTKANNVLQGMGLDGLGKTNKAIQELTDKGMDPR
jgi:uncharacterized cupin superfamily protein